MLPQLNETLAPHGWKARSEKETGRYVIEHVGRYGMMDSPLFGEFVYNPEGQNISLVIANVVAMTAMAARAYTAGCTHAREHERKTVMSNLERWIFEK